MNKLLTVLVLSLTVMALPIKSYAFTDAQSWKIVAKAVWLLHHHHHVCPTAAGTSKGHFIFATGPEIFIGSVFGLAFAIGHDHWLGCKNKYGVGTVERAACQSEPMWPMTIPNVMIGMGNGNVGNFPNGIDK